LESEIFRTKFVHKIKSHILRSITYFRNVYEIKRVRILQPDRPQKTVRRMRIACWIPKATDTRSEYVILVSYTRHQRLHERAPPSHHYVYCLSCLFSSCCCSARYKPIHVLLFFCTIMLLFLDPFCAVLLLVGCNLPKACKTNITYEYNQEDAGIRVETRMTKKKLQIVERQLAVPINNILSSSLPTHVLKNLRYTIIGCIW